MLTATQCLGSIMKNRISRMWVVAGLGTALLTTASVSAQSAASTNSSTATPAAPVAQAAPVVKLPYGAEDVLKLSRAQISEDIILNYVQNSGTVYSLTPNDIVYLRNEGVSDRVVTAMLNQRQRVVADAAAQQMAAQQAAAQQAAAQQAATPAPAPAYPDNTSVAAAPTYAPAYEQPQPQPAPSTVYVIPDPSVEYAYYGYPYYYPGPYYYGGYWGPSVSIGLGFGGHYGGHYYGGYHGGGFHGGGGFHHR
jgi:type II secretory pathway pseudopilin PulG